MKVTVDRRRLRARMIEEDKNSLIRALKADDPKAAKQALTGMSGEDLDLASKEFGELFRNIEQANMTFEPETLDKARQILKVGQDTKQSTATHNPVTGQQWSSGPVKDAGQQKGYKQIQTTPEETKIVRAYGQGNLYGYEYAELKDLYDKLTMHAGDPKVVDSLMYKVSEIARFLYPHKYKDSDFRDI